jgi:hypothetical protein
MARRFTPNTVSSLGEVDALFRGQPRGIARRIRCAVCENDVRLTHISARAWLLEHGCRGPNPVSDRAVGATIKPSHPSSGRLTTCECCGRAVPVETVNDHRFSCLDTVMKTNGAESGAWGFVDLVA